MTKEQRSRCMASIHGPNWQTWGRYGMSVEAQGEGADIAIVGIHTKQDFH